MVGIERGEESMVQDEAGETGRTGHTEPKNKGRKDLMF